MDKVIVRFFGRLAEVYGLSAEIPLDADRCSVSGLRDRIGRLFPQAGDIADPSVRAVVADAVVGEDHLLKPDDEVEFLPIVSGG